MIWARRLICQVNRIWSTGAGVSVEYEISDLDILKIAFLSFDRHRLYRYILQERSVYPQFFLVIFINIRPQKKKR